METPDIRKDRYNLDLGPQDRNTISCEDQQAQVHQTGRESITTAKQRTSHLLRLPPELRNKIYKHVLSGNIQAYAGYYNDWDKDSQSKLHFLGTCRQIRYEATLILYGTATFQFELLFQIENFACRIWDQRLSSIRSVALPASSAEALVNPEFADAIFWLRIFPGLEEVRFMGDIDQATQAALSSLVFRADGRDVWIILEQPEQSGSLVV